MQIFVEYLSQSNRSRLRRLILILGFVLAFTVVTPSVAQPTTAFNVRDLGARGDGATDDSAAIAAAIAKAMAAGPGEELFFPAGTYKITHSIDIFGAKGLTLQGEATTRVVMNNAADAMLEIRNCQDLTVRQMSFDRWPLPLTQGTIDAVDVAGKTCDVTLDPGYDGFDAPQFAHGGTFSPFVYPESGTYQLDRYPSPFVSATSLGDSHWKIFFKDPPPQDQWLGKKFVFWVGGHGHCIEASGLKNALFEDIHYCGGGSAGLYLSDLSGTIAFHHFVIGVPLGSGRLFAECGGGQISHIRGKLLFEDCDFSRIDDDGLDILGNWTRVVSQVDPHTLQLQSSAGIQTGDHIQLWDWDTKASRSEAIVQRVSTNQDRTINVTLDRNVKTERVGAGDGKPFGSVAAVDGIDRVVDLDDMSEQTVIRNCNFQVFRAKCLNLKANNCLVEGCHFYGSYQPAISAAPEWYFEEGPTVRHLVIRDNTFQTCNHSNIEIGATGSPNPAPSRDTIDVLIEGNRFENYGALPSVFAKYYPIGDAIRVQNAKDVVIRHNDFGQAASTVPAGFPKLIVKDSDHVVIQDNANLSKSQIQEDNVSP